MRCCPDIQFKPPLEKLFLSFLLSQGFSCLGLRTQVSEPLLWKGHVLFTALPSASSPGEMWNNLLLLAVTAPGAISGLEAFLGQLITRLWCGGVGWAGGASLER